MSKRELQRKSNLLVLASVGIVLGMFAISFVLPDGDLVMAGVIGVLLTAAICWYYGLVYYCLSKNQPGTYAILGLLLSFVGLLIIAGLPDHWPEESSREPSDSPDGTAPRGTTFQ